MVGFGSNNNKILAYEYVLKKLLVWQESSCHISTDKNDISILKSLKLLFFLSAVDTKKDSNNFLLERVFDKFYAMPLGHVESDIYNHIIKSNGKLDYYQINDVKTIVIDGQNPGDIDKNLDSEVRIAIDEALIKLQKINPKLICMPAYALVELSHLWASWKRNYSMAIKLKKFSQIIEADEIIGENKIFSAQTF